MSITTAFFPIIKYTYGTWIKTRYRLTGVGFEEISKVGPHVVLANHTHVLDPFFISAYYPHNIRWVAGAYLFKNRALKSLLVNLVGSIGKQQGRGDIHTIKTIHQALKEGDTVGLFPEATRTWDGELRYFDESIAKLIKLFKVPVVFINMEGTFALKPRWVFHTRKGKSTIRVKKILSTQEIDSLPVQQLYELIRSTLAFSHTQWQQKEKHPFTHPKKAEKLEQFLYACPSCERYSTLKSKHTRLYCSHCDLVMELDPYEKLLLITGDNKGIHSLSEWNTWQQEFLGNHLEQMPSDRGTLLQRGIDGKLLTLATRMSVQLQPSEILITLPRIPKGGALHNIETIHFDYSSIRSFAINAKGTMDFFHKDQLWRVRLAKGESTLKYQQWYEKLLQRNTT